MFEPDGQVTRHEGNYSLYLELTAQAKAQAAADLASETAAKKSNDRREKANPESGGGKKKGLSFAQRRELETIVGQIEATEAEAEALGAQLADPTTYAAGPGKVAEITTKLGAARSRAQTLTTRREQLEALKDI